MAIYHLSVKAIGRSAGRSAKVVGNNVDVLVTYSTPAALAAKKATSTVPIVVASMGDPVGTGEAQSLARPGGNLTGLSLGYADIAGKWLELAQETVPRLSTVALISNPDSPGVRTRGEGDRGDRANTSVEGSRPRRARTRRARWRVAPGWQKIRCTEPPTAVG